MVYVTNNQKQRAAHWRDIQSTVKTHEGELLTGKKGREYQKKWSKKYLGRDLSQGKPADTRMVEEFEAKKK